MSSSLKQSARRLARDWRFTLTAVVTLAVAISANTVGGIIIGFGLLAAVNRGLSSLLFGVGALDPVTIALAALVTVVIGFVATYLPARRILEIDPVEALRR